MLASGHQYALLAEAGDFAAAQIVQARWEHLALRSRETLYRWWVQVGNVSLAISQGRFAEADSLAQDALALEQRLTNGPPLQHLVQMVVLWSIQGRRAALESVLATQANRPGPYPGLHQQCAIANIARELGRSAEARATLERIAAREFVDLPQDGTWFSSMHYLAEVCSFVADVGRATQLVELLGPYEQRAAVNHASGVYLAPIAYDLALLESVLGRWDDAARHFGNALEMSRAYGARPAVARTQCEYARMLLARGGGDDVDKVRALLAEALAAASALDMPLLLERVQEMQRSLDAPNDGPAVSTAIAHRSPSSRIFRRDGDYWSIGERDTPVRLKDSKGLQYL